MNRVHIANTDFEFELAHPTKSALENRWKGNPFCLQLQYLPLLYGEENDIVAVTQLPDETFLETLNRIPWRQGAGLPQTALLEEVAPYENCECHSWGYSKAVQNWALHRKMHYFMPDWELVKEVNSKAFSHRFNLETAIGSSKKVQDFESESLGMGAEHSQKVKAAPIPSDYGSKSCTFLLDPIAVSRFTPFSQSMLIWNSSGLLAWINSFPGKKVLKTCFGLSGRGMKIFDETVQPDELVRFCEKEWKEKRPIVAEPWLERVFDFSTQWDIGRDEITLIGSTVFETSPHGTYQATLAGPEQDIFCRWTSFLKEHQVCAKQVLHEMQKSGFYGNAGIDALLYKDHGNESICLYPIVEVNARKTMSWVALKLQQKFFPGETIKFEFVHYTSKEIPLLPLALQGVKPFTHSLSCRQV